MNKQNIKPHDVVQIDPSHDGRFGGLLMVVTKLTPDGPFGYISVPKGCEANPEKLTVCLAESADGWHRPYYIVPFNKCFKIGTAEWVIRDADSDSSSDIPFIGFSAARLAKLPDVKEGEFIECTTCGAEHQLQAADSTTGGAQSTDGKPQTLLVYECQGNWKLGAVGGKLIVGVEPTVKG